MATAANSTARPSSGAGDVVSSGDPQLGPLGVQPGRHADDGDVLGDEPGAGRGPFGDPHSSSISAGSHGLPTADSTSAPTELCLEGPLAQQVECVIFVAGIDPGEAVQLTTEVQPVGGGTTTPAPGTQQVVLNSVIPLKATPRPGFRFSEWSPNVTNPADIANHRVHGHVEDRHGQLRRVRLRG